MLWATKTKMLNQISINIRKFIISHKCRDKTISSYCSQPYQEPCFSLCLLWEQFSIRLSVSWTDRGWHQRREKEHFLWSLSQEQGNLSQKSPIRTLLRFQLPNWILYISKPNTGNKNRVTMIDFLNKAEFRNAEFRITALFHRGKWGELG